MGDSSGDRIDIVLGIKPQRIPARRPINSGHRHFRSTLH